MADPWDITGSNAAADITSSPDFWRNLMAFGNATMAAASRPGATTLGSLGQGGMAATEQARTNAAARSEIENRKAEAYNRTMQGRMLEQQVGMMQRAPQMFPALFNQVQNPATMPSSIAPTNMSTPQESSGTVNQPWSTVAGKDISTTNPRINSYPTGSAAGIVPVDAMNLPALPVENRRARTSKLNIPNAPAELDNSPEAIQAALQGEKAVQQQRQAAFLPPENQPLVNRAAAIQAGALGQIYNLPQLAGLSNLAQVPAGYEVTKSGGLRIAPQGPADPNVIARTKEAERNVDEFTQYTSELGDRAASAPSANDALDNLKFAAQTAQPDAFGDARMRARSAVQATKHLFSDKVPEDEILDAMVDIKKNEGIIMRDVLKSTYTTRVTNMDNQIVAPTLPGLVQDQLI